MYNSEAELLFPLRVAASLNDLRGEEWQRLIALVSREDADPLDQCGFVYMMVKLGGCAPCNSDSFRAMKGCAACARQTVGRFRGSDQELWNLFSASKSEVLAHLKRQENQ